ncbi:MAG: enterochelin esterase-like enzyme [Cyclobacteriaceae bacterium]|jgi:enterochelin esterase-like enzyme
MKHYYIFSALCLALISARAQSTVQENHTIKSRILQQEINYTIYLPEGYNSSVRDYPVLYLLHGFTDDHTAWIQYGMMQHLTDQAISSGEALEMIVVMPDADLTWYINTFDGYRYEDFFIQEFIPYIERSYRIRAQKAYRAIAGLSMGGHGSLLYALKYPELFVASAPLSASVRSNEEFIAMSDEQWDNMFALPFGKNKGKDRITDHLKANTALNIINQRTAAELSQVRYYIDCGDDDHLIYCNMELHKALKRKFVDHEFRVRDGGHEWSYWRSALPEVLLFVSASFRK